MIQIPISDTQFASLTTRLRTNGIELNGPSGTLNKDGVTANYTHANGTLTVEITGHPSYYPVPLIESKLQSYLEQSIAYDASKSAT
jgi:hypothetical protein